MKWKPPQIGRNSIHISIRKLYLFSVIFVMERTNETGEREEEREEERETERERERKRKRD